MLSDKLPAQPTTQSEQPSVKNHSTQSFNIAVLGGKGAYSHLAAGQFFNQSKNAYLACSSFEKIIFKVEEGDADYGVIPIENTTSGGITEVYDCLLEADLTIVGETTYAVNHCLVGKKNDCLKNITHVVAHPQASRQCSQQLKQLVSAKMIWVESTAHALALVTKSSTQNTAAIASKEAAELFNLTVLQSNISNQAENITRFLVLAQSTNPVALSTQCKTSIALSTGQKPGSLADVLCLFRDANIPLCRLESRPIVNKPWEQMFYVDLEGNIADKKLKWTIEQVSNSCLFLRVLGSYPRSLSENRKPAIASIPRQAPGAVFDE